MTSPFDSSLPNSFRDVMDLWESLQAFVDEIADLDLAPAEARGSLYQKARKWRAKDNIPAGYWRIVIQAADKIGHPEVTADSLVLLADERRRRLSSLTTPT